jgi:hypothetical protein
MAETGAVTTLMSEAQNDSKFDRPIREAAGAGAS